MKRHEMTGQQWSQNSHLALLYLKAVFYPLRDVSQIREQASLSSTGHDAKVKLENIVDHRMTRIEPKNLCQLKFLLVGRE
jgi:hypothetical protein